ncbi:MAG: ATP-binding protein [Chloroflexota bacterium]
MITKNMEDRNSVTSSNTKASKQTEGQTTEIESLYRDMVELSPDGILTIDTKGVIKSCNTAATRMLGYPKDYFIGGHFAKLGSLRLKDIPRYLKLFKDILGGKTGETIEAAVYRKDKTLIFVDVRVNLLKINKKTVMQAILRDITERKLAENKLQEKNEQLDAQNEELRAVNEELQATEEELRATNEELREAQERLICSEKLAAIGQLASGVGHELRNPLGAIKNAVLFIRRKIASTDLPAREPRVMEFLDIMDEEVSAANKVITDLLDFSRVVKPTTALTHMDSVIEDALRHTQLSENIELLKDIDTNLPMVMVDADQIRQVFLNIIFNAQQAMPEGGFLKVQACSNGEFLEISFTDNGGGIPQSVMKKIFDPLFTTKAKGIGLGLAVCKSILEKHGGDIKIESEEGKGATFAVYLPVK